MLRTIPATMVILHELWIRFPNGRWQYYRILKNAIIEFLTAGILTGPQLTLTSLS